MKFLRLVEILLPAMLLTACTATPEECDPTRDPGFFNKIGCTFSGLVKIYKVVIYQSLMVYGN